MRDGYRDFYPALDPFRVDHLPVGDGHELYIEQSGNPEGAPVLYLHGGPGGATHPSLRRYFDPDHYRIILMDQRGCGNSTPTGAIESNTTWHLVADMERIREFLNIDRWHLAGGSWGSTLALAYAEQNRARVASLVLRSIFLGRRKEVDWLYGGGAGLFFPEEWQQFRAFIPEAERSDMVRAYYRRLLGSDEDQKHEAALNWCRWETCLLHLDQDPASVPVLDSEQALALARLETHYFANNCFLKADDQILRDAVLLRDIPGTIVHGRYDLITPPAAAYELKARWPTAHLHMATLAGHAADEPALVHHMVEATDAMRVIET